MTTRSQHGVLTSRTRFLRAARSLPVDRRPVWMMRQAGRSLPEYRRLRQRRSFRELCFHPELSAEATLQPIRRFGLDAAVHFSDILVVPEGLGQGFRFDDEKGIRLDFRIRGERDLALIDPARLDERLTPVYDAIRLLRGALGAETALVGFAGAPWTLANFMLEGGASRDGRPALAAYLENRRFVEALLSKIAAGIVRHGRAQVAAGADAIQLFESYAGFLPADLFEELSGRWLRRIIRALGEKVPVIVFARGAHDAWESLARTGASVVSVDAGVRLAEARRRLPRRIALQGNLDPVFLTTDPAITRRATRRMLAELPDGRGHIANLGHGVPPQARLDAIEAFVETVKQMMNDE
jgi:uroporphyrinogen decarboxylase